jgi:phosphohistidine swiveling domain-containing protein
LTEPSLIPLAEVTDAVLRRKAVGSRALSLLRLREHDLPVARSWVIPTDVFHRVVAVSIDPEVEPSSLIGDIEHTDGPRRAAAAAAGMRGATIPAGLRSALASLTRLAGDGTRFVVLPSPTLKDEALIRAAGLDVPQGPLSHGAALDDAIRSAWALAFEERVLLALRRERVRDLAMAVVVASIPAHAEVATAYAVPDGVCLTDRSKRTWVRIGGRGEIAERVRCAVSVASPLVEGWGRDEAREASEPFSAGNSGRVEVVRVVRAIDGIDGPASSLVAVDAEGSRVLGTSRIKALPLIHGGDDETTWSSVRVGDTLPEVPTPFSGSLYEQFESVAARATSALFGVRASRSAAFFGNVNGRLYVNESLLDSIAHAGVTRSEASADPSLVALSMAFTRVFGIEQGLEREARQVERDADAYFRWLSEMDLGILPDDGLTTTLVEARHHLFTAWQLRLTAIGTLAAISQTARRLFARRLGADARRLARMLGGSAADLETTALARAWHHVAALIASDPEARDLVAAGAPSVAGLPDGPGRRALASFLSAYGDHGPCASEIAAARWRDDEGALLGLLRAGLSTPLQDLDPILAEGRAAVEREIASAQSRLSFFEGRMLSHALPRLRKVVALADRSQRLSIRAASALRSILLDVDRRLLRREPTLRRGSAFLCRFDEIRELLEQPKLELGVLARQRLLGWRRAVHGARVASRFKGAVVTQAPFGSEPARGIGSGRGTVVGVARRVTAWDAVSLGAVRPGDVVVTAALDPALLPLLFVAAGVVAERGSEWTTGLPLARERGVPVVVAVGDAARRFVDGVSLEVDAVGGTVQVR